MLTFGARTYIASPDALRLEGLLGGDALFLVLGGSGEGSTAQGEILSLEPDFLLLDSALAGMDSLKLLEILGREMTAPPRVLYLCPEETWKESAVGKGADAALIAPKTREELLFCARQTALRPLPRLALPWQDTREEIAGALLAALGADPRLKGKTYMRWAGAALACAPQLAASYSGRLYPYLAERGNATPQAVERAVRTAVEAIWLQGNLEAIERLFGFSVDADRGKPTNAEFLSMLGEHVRRETARRMKEEM